jgi:hypothetical protein
MASQTTTPSAADADGPQTKLYSDHSREQDEEFASEVQR